MDTQLVTICHDPGSVHAVKPNPTFLQQIAVCLLLETGYNLTCRVYARLLPAAHPICNAESAAAHITHKECILASVGLLQKIGIGYTVLGYSPSNLFLTSRVLQMSMKSAART